MPLSTMKRRLRWEAPRGNHLLIREAKSPGVHSVGCDPVTTRRQHLNRHTLSSVRTVHSSPALSGSVKTHTCPSGFTFWTMSFACSSEQFDPIRAIVLL